jgi:hypothetical protein
MNLPHATLSNPDSIIRTGVAIASTNGSQAAIDEWIAGGDLDGSNSSLRCIVLRSQPRRGNMRLLIGVSQVRTRTYLKIA